MALDLSTVVEVNFHDSITRLGWSNTTTATDASAC